MFRDCKGFFSILLQTVVDANYRFMAIDAEPIRYLLKLKKQYDICIKNVSCFDTEKNIIKNKIQSRKQFSVQQIHSAANVLHPKYRGNNLTADENIEAATFIHRLSTICLDIDEQKVKEGIFSNTYVWEVCINLEPTVWWNAYYSSTELSKLFSKILSLPATSAACERTFSTYKDVHSSKRNRLTDSRAGKLVYEKQVNPPLAQQDYYEKLLEEFEEDSNNEVQLEKIEYEDNTKESDCSVISVNLENEEEQNSDIDTDSTELMNMINS
ncbi:hypothetical protein QTP88_011834 [Uroleucon formosanum]